jgi:hypothetical protein
VCARRCACVCLRGRAGSDSHAIDDSSSRVISRSGRPEMVTGRMPGRCRRAERDLEGACSSGLRGLGRVRSAVTGFRRQRWRWSSRLLRADLEMPVKWETAAPHWASSRRMLSPVIWRESCEQRGLSRACPAGGQRERGAFLSWRVGVCQRLGRVRGAGGEGALWGARARS